jgi:hypothetical protein
VSRAADIAARLTAGCVWGLLALIATVFVAAVYLSPFVALWYLLP